MRRAAVTLLPVLLLARIAPAATGAARPSAGTGAATFERSVAVARATAGGWRTPVVAAGRRFQLVGATWRAATAADGVQLRARRVGGGWTRWAPADAGDPVWSGWSDAVQLRGAGSPPAGLRLRFVAVGAAAAAGVPRAAASEAAAGAPALVPRSAWDPHDACHPRVQARYGRVDFAIVHHTESLSSYSRAESPAIVLGICLFHRDVNDWHDIGYDLLVDRYGTVFDGRAGGAEQPTIGAQAGGWNAVSTGVAMIGSYGVAPPPAAALRALERVLAWKLSLAGVPAQGVVSERSTGEDPADNRWPRGALVRFQRIAGHRDADSTDCPGGALYALLPRIRRDVAALMPAPRDLLTISPVGAPVDPGPWELTGRLALASGRRPAGVEVDVQQQTPDGTWMQVATTRTGADGIWSAAPALTADGAMRALAPSLDPAPPAAPPPLPAPSSAPALVSQIVAAQVRAGVRLHLAHTHARADAELSVSGATSPPKAHVTLWVARRIASGRYGRGRRIAVATAADGRFSATVRLSRPGVYRLLALTSADTLNAAGESRAGFVRVLGR